MTDDEVGFLRTAAANPADDLTRLVYADWLEERGDEVSVARGRFVRLQVKRAGLSATDPQWKAALDEERDLLRRFGRKWNGSIHRRLYQHGLRQKVDARSGPIRGWRYTRGMVGTVKAEWSAVLVSPDWVFGLGPVRRLRICGPISFSGEGITPLVGRLLAVDLPPGVGAVGPWEPLFKAFAAVPVLHFRGGHLWPLQVTQLRALIAANRCSPVILFRQSGATSDWAVLDPFGKWPALRAEFENLTEMSVPATPTTPPGGSP
jgi:uncharacterized protein (TIGR02996 family)